MPSERAPSSPVAPAESPARRLRIGLLVMLVLLLCYRSIEVSAVASVTHSVGPPVASAGGHPQVATTSPPPPPPPPTLPPPTRNSNVSDAVDAGRAVPVPWDPAVPAVVEAVPGLRDRSTWREVRLTGPQWAAAVRYVWSKVLAATAEDVAVGELLARPPTRGGDPDAEYINLAHDGGGDAKRKFHEDAFDPHALPASLRPNMFSAAELRFPCGILTASVLKLDWVARVADVTRRALLEPALPPSIEASLPSALLLAPSPAAAGTTTALRLHGVRLTPSSHLPIVYVEQHLVRAFVETFLPAHAARVRHRSAMPVASSPLSSQRRSPTSTTSKAGDDASGTDGDAKAAVEAAIRERFPHGVPAVPLVVVTACRDLGPRRYLASQGRAALLAAALDSPAVHRWFANQCDTAHPKLECVPLGMAFHAHFTASGDGDHPAVQADTIADIARAAKPLGERPTVALLDPWKDTHNHLRAQVRADVLARLPMANVHLLTPASLRQPAAATATASSDASKRGLGPARESAAAAFARQHPQGMRSVSGEVASRRVSTRAMWRAYAAAAFVVSPPGGGWDCHRTWEAIAVGAVPIVWNSSAYRVAHAVAAAPHGGGGKDAFDARNVDDDASLQDLNAENALVEGLPVVVVQSYREISPAKLRAWQADIAARRAQGEFDAGLRRLSNAYWVQRLHAAARAGLAMFLRR